MKIQLQNAADIIMLEKLFKQKTHEYQQDLCQEGLTQQQYDILRGQIKELNDLISVLNLKQPSQP